VQCEACYTPLPATTTCPNCGAIVQTDASFCGQCGFNLRSVASETVPVAPVPVGGEMPAVAGMPEIPPLVPVDPLVIPEPLIPEPLIPEPLVPEPLVPEPLMPPAVEMPPAPSETPPALEAAMLANANASADSAAPPDNNQPELGSSPSATGMRTQLQQANARLLHIQTNSRVELPPHLSLIHMGKPNDRVPPDIDVSGFPDSEIVSRVHADIRVEAGIYYIEDLGSSNGTYINNSPLPPGNRHRLRPGDRIALGKGDKVTFLFQLA